MIFFQQVMYKTQISKFSIKNHFFTCVTSGFLGENYSDTIVKFLLICFLVMAGA